MVRKAVNAARMCHTLAGYIGPPQAVADIMIERFTRLSQERLGCWRKWRPKKFYFKLEGKRYDFVCHERRIPYLIIKEIFFDKCYKPTRDLENGDLTIVDCGANIGIASAWFLWNYSNATVHAFEPSPTTFEHLSSNVNSWNEADRVVLNNKGVWSSNSTRTLFLDPTSSGGNSFLPGWIAYWGFQPTSREVSATRLDQYMHDEGIDRIDLLKFDIEGGELEALKGLGDRISDVHVVIGELHEPNELMAAREELAAFFRSHGFSFEIRQILSPKMAVFEAINQNFE